MSGLPETRETIVTVWRIVVKFVTDVNTVVVSIVLVLVIVLGAAESESQLQASCRSLQGRQLSSMMVYVGKFCKLEGTTE